MTLTFTHPRADWVTTRPVTGPTFDWSKIDYFVVHWPGHDGVPDGDIGDRTDIGAYIRNTHHIYLDDPNRGYSLGYSSFADYLGGTWECRGDTFRAASNAPQAFNERAFSCNYLTDLDGNHTLEGVGAVNGLIAQVRALRPHVKVIPHRHGPLYVKGATQTQCPGNKIAALIEGGIIGAAPKPGPTPTPGGYIVPDIYVPNEIIADAPPSVGGVPADANWLWVTAFQQMQIERPGTINPQNSGIVRQIQFGINNAIDQGTIAGPKVQINGVYDQVTAEGWNRWLKRVE